MTHVQPFSGNFLSNLFLSANRAKCCKQTCQPSPGLIANQIISFIFALTIYDELDDNVMVTDRNNYTFDSATMTMSHYDIGRIEVDA